MDAGLQINIVCKKCGSRLQIASTPDFVSRTELKCPTCFEILHVSNTPHMHFVSKVLEIRHDHEDLTQHA